MIDELPTRAALTGAAFLLLATGLSVLSVFGGDAVRDAAHALAGHLGRALDEVTALEGVAVFRGGVGGAGPFELPPTLAGSSYRIEVRATDVRVTAGTFVAVAAFRAPIHPFAPDRESFSSSDLRSLDAATLSVAGGAPFVVARASHVVDGAPTFLTFVHLP